MHVGVLRDPYPGPEVLAMVAEPDATREVNLYHKFAAIAERLDLTLLQPPLPGDPLRGDLALPPWTFVANAELYFH